MYFINKQIIQFIQRGGILITFTHTVNRPSVLKPSNLKKFSCITVNSGRTVMSPTRLDNLYHLQEAMFHTIAILSIYQ